MSMHYDFAKAEIAARLEHAETRRTARIARGRHRPTSRRQRRRAT
jgi:hypothetical protein